MHYICCKTTPYLSATSKRIKRDVYNNTVQVCCDLNIKSITEKLHFNKTLLKCSRTADYLSKSYENLFYIEKNHFIKPMITF